VNDTVAEGGRPTGACCFTSAPCQTATGGSGVDLFAYDPSAGHQTWRHVAASSVWFQGTGFGSGSLALSLCTTAHPFYTSCTNIIGSSFC
jgi:hypothetical protein